MKAIITLLFILSVGITAQAKDIKNSLNKEVTKEVKVKELKLEKENNVARLYKYKNYRVIKALSFATKKNKAKLV